VIRVNVIFYKDLPLLKNDITNILGSQKPVIYSETVEKVQFWHFF